MSEIPPEVEHSAEVQQALIGLHALAGTYGSRDPGAVSTISTGDPGSNLRVLASAPPELVPVSARLALLYRLAQAGYPQREALEGDYQALAATVSHDRGMSPAELLDDLRTATQARGGLVASQTVRSSQHHEVAFLGQDVCTVRRVTVDGRDAIWIFSEFETDAPFENVAQWVDPRTWPDRAPLLFRGMQIVGAPKPVNIDDSSAGRGLEHWHSVFLEQVQLVKPVSTLLHCDFRRDGTQSAGMTYELAFSPDNEIDVDRGFLLVNEVDGIRHVKALKIVGFVDGVWNDVAEFVCPFWTDWVRQAVRGGHNSDARPPTHTPPGAPSTPPFADSLETWVQFLGESAVTYLRLFDDVTTRMSRPGYGSSDLLGDGRRYWSQLAKDWARAWTTGLDALDGIAEQGLDAGIPTPTTRPGATSGAGRTGAGATGAGTAARGFRAGAPGGRGPAPGGGPGAAPGAPSPGGGPGREEPEETVIPVAGLAEGEALAVTDLTSIEAGGATIPAAEVTVTRTSLPGGVAGVRVQTRNRAVPPGLYVGEVRNAAGQRLAPVQLYLSRAREA